MKIMNKLKQAFSFFEDEVEYIEKEEETIVPPVSIKTKVEIDSNPTKLPTILQDELYKDTSFTSKSDFPFPVNVDNNINSIKEDIKVVKEPSVQKIEAKTIDLDYKPKETIKQTPVKPSFEEIKPKKSSYEEERKFVPSQRISPVYGILGKNYKKEDIKIKDERSYEIPRRKGLNYEDVRKKAYGTLVDDLEQNLYEENLKIKNTINDLDNLINNMNKEKLVEFNNKYEINSQTKEEDIKIDTTDIYDITIPNIQIRSIQIDEDKLDKTLVNVPLGVDLANRLKEEQVQIIDHNNNDVTNVNIKKNDDLYNILSDFYKEEEG